MGHSNRSELFVGIDYHQDPLQVCVMDRGGRVVVNRAVGNDWRSVVSTTRGLGRVRRAAIEACNGAADLAEELTERAGWSVDLAHAGYVARLKGSPDKTDFTDAQLLADLTRVGYLPRVWLPPAWVRELRRLVRYRQQQVDERRNARLRIGALLRDHRLRTPRGVRPWTRAWLRGLAEASARLPEGSRWIVAQQMEKIAWLSERVARAEARLGDHCRGDALTGRLLDQPGVGPVTAWVLRAEVGRFDRFDSGKALARFCGLSPRNVSSGQRIADAGLIKAGSDLLRATLIELGWRLIRQTPRWRSMAQGLRGRGKKPCVIVAAVANRWVRGLYRIMVETGTEPVVDPCGAALADAGAAAGPR